MSAISKMLLTAHHCEAHTRGGFSCRCKRKLVERVTAARAEIARERAAADQLAQAIATEVETLILSQPAQTN